MNPEYKFRLGLRINPAQSLAAHHFELILRLKYRNGAVIFQENEFSMAKILRFLDSTSASVAAT